MQLFSSIFIENNDEQIHTLNTITNQLKTTAASHDASIGELLQTTSSVQS